MTFLKTGGTLYSKFVIELSSTIIKIMKSGLSLGCLILMLGAPKRGLSTYVVQCLTPKHMILK